MSLLDISLTLSPDLPTWPDDPEINLERISSVAEGDDANVTQLSMTVHTGTHVDAPVHFLDGAGTIEDLALDLMVGPAVVIELGTRDTITRRDLEQTAIPTSAQRILLKTQNSRFWERGELTFQKDYAALGADAARYLVEIGVEVVGVDYLSVAPFSDPVPTHQILLEAGVLIIEGLDLSRAKPGNYTLLCLPLKISAADGAPARVLLMK